MDEPLAPQAYHLYPVDAQQPPPDRKMARFSSGNSSPQQQKESAGAGEPMHISPVPGFAPSHGTNLIERVANELHEFDGQRIDSPSKKTESESPTLRKTKSTSGLQPSLENSQNGPQDRQRERSSSRPQVSTEPSRKSSPSKETKDAAPTKPATLPSTPPRIPSATGSSGGKQPRPVSRTPPRSQEPRDPPSEPQPQPQPQAQPHHPTHSPTQEAISPEQAHKQSKASSNLDVVETDEQRLSPKATFSPRAAHLTPEKKAILPLASAMRRDLHLADPLLSKMLTVDQINHRQQGRVGGQGGIALTNLGRHYQHELSLLTKELDGMRNRSIEHRQVIKADRELRESEVAYSITLDFTALGYRAGEESREIQARK
jgi:hypothetical protein